MIIAAALWNSYPDKIIDRGRGGTEEDIGKDTNLNHFYFNTPTVSGELFLRWHVITIQPFLLSLLPQSRLLYVFTEPYSQWHSQGSCVVSVRKLAWWTDGRRGVQNIPDLQK